jgi:predicted acyl esterase
MTIEWDVAVPTSDGTVLRANVFRPLDGAPAPVIMSMHPYGKDDIAARSRSGRRLNFQYHAFPQPDPIRFSTLTGWESPDPAFWVEHGYAVVNVDERGAGTAEGRTDLLSEQEARDYHDVVEWAAAQPWSTGRIGLDGVSYLAIAQYRVASLRPPHLAAICPWEGFSDVYRDFARPGGGREDGFSILWSAVIKRKARVVESLRREFVRRAERDEWYDAHTPVLEDIDVPMLVCASFSDHSLHSRGSFEAFRRAGSARKWLTTHRSGKWSTYYSDAAAAERLAFFDHALKDADNGWAARPPVVITVHEVDGPPVAELTASEWPPGDLQIETRHLDNVTATLTEQAGTRSTSAAFPTRTGSLTWRWVVLHDVDIVGPMALTLHVSLEGADDTVLTVAVRKFRAGREVHFQGSYGFSRDVVSKGWQRIAHRELDHALSTELQPVHTHVGAAPVARGEVVPVQIALLPHATRFRAGDELRLEVRGRWLFPRNPLTGQFPAGYQRPSRATCTVHTGGEHPSTLRFGTRAVSHG